MQRVAVKSSNIKSVGHEGDTMEVEFHTGGIYTYHGVKEHHFKSLLKADSIGNHFHKHIKTSFKFKKV